MEPGAHVDGIAQAPTPTGEHRSRGAKHAVNAQGPVRRARGQAVAPADLALITLPHPDYLDLHQLTVQDSDDWSAEAWARSMFEDDRPLAERVRRLGLLGLLLSAPQPDGHVAGWVVTEANLSLLRMESRSRLTRDQVVVRVDAAGVTLLTAVGYQHRAAALIWPLIATQHRRLAPCVLRRAHERLRRHASE